MMFKKMYIQKYVLVIREFLKEKANTILTGRNQNDLENSYEKFSGIYGKQKVHKFISFVNCQN